MDRTALVTGSNSGIGFEIVRKLLRDGYFVIAHYHKNCDNLNSLADDRLTTIGADFSDEKQFFLFLETIECKYNVDILINNTAVYTQIGLSTKINSYSSLQPNLNVNLHAPFILLNRLSGQMTDRKFGRIINISSIGVKYGGNPSSMYYTIAKSALEIMVRSSAKVLTESNVMINAIRVGVTDTDFHSVSNKNIPERVKIIPAKRMAQPEEIAELVSFLISDRCTYMSGAVLEISGGE